MLLCHTGGWRLLSSTTVTPSLRHCECVITISQSLQCALPSVDRTCKQSKPQIGKNVEIIAGRGNILLDSARHREGSEEDVMEDG